MADINNTTSSEANAVPEKTYELKKEQELRLEIESEQKCFITLLSGTAEHFGSEYELGVEYQLTVPLGHVAKRVAVFTWHGCALKIRGNTKTAYIKSETPMISYINTHAALENLRQLARTQPNRSGPRTMIVGPMDSGKSTLCRILLNYGVRADNRPIFVDLDVGQNSISLPGAIAATSVEHPFPIDGNALNLQAPLAYFFGHTSLDKAPELYTKLVEKMAAAVDKRMSEHAIVRNSGIIVNTCGWVDDQGYDFLLKIAEKFKIDVILVLEKDDLTQRLQDDEFIKGLKCYVAPLAKSGGVAQRDTEYRKRTRAQAIRDYFYGPHRELTPHQKIVKFHDVAIYRVGGGPAAPDSALPLGSKRVVDPNKLTLVTPSNDLLHTLLAVSYAKESANMLESNIAGYIHVSAVDAVKKTLTLLTPAPGPLPSTLLLCGSIKWID